MDISQEFVLMSWCVVSTSLVLDAWGFVLSSVMFWCAVLWRVAVWRLKLFSWVRRIPELEEPRWVWIEGGTPQACKSKPHSTHSPTPRLSARASELLELDWCRMQIARTFSTSLPGERKRWRQVWFLVNICFRSTKRIRLKHIVTLVHHRKQVCPSSELIVKVSVHHMGSTVQTSHATLAWPKLGNGYESWKTWLSAPFYLLQSGHPADAAWRGHGEEKKRFPWLNMGWMETASSNCSLLTGVLFDRRVFPRSPPPPLPTDTKEIFFLCCCCLFRPTCSNLMNHTWGEHGCHSCPAAHPPAGRIITWKPVKQSNRFLLYLSVC